MLVSFATVREEIMAGPPRGPLEDTHLSPFGYAVTALNPKSNVFFIAFVPQFVVADAPLLPQFSILIATFVGLAAVNTVLWAVLVGDHRVDRRAGHRFRLKTASPARSSARGLPRPRPRGR